MGKISKELREMMTHNNSKQWEVAAKIGVSEYTLIRWLRGEPSTEHAHMIEKAIEELTQEDKQHG